MAMVQDKIESAGAQPAAARLPHPASTKVEMVPEKSQAKITDPILRIGKLDRYYGKSQALKRSELDIPRRLVTAFIGPSGCGKSTLLRCFNRMNDLIDNIRIEGSIKLDGDEITDPALDVI